MAQQMGVMYVVEHAENDCLADFDSFVAPYGTELLREQLQPPPLPGQCKCRDRHVFASVAYGYIHAGDGPSLRRWLRTRCGVLKPDAALVFLPQICGPCFDAHWLHRCAEDPELLRVALEVPDLVNDGHIARWSHFHFSPLDHAIFAHQPRCVEMLLTAGAWPMFPCKAINEHRFEDSPHLPTVIRPFTHRYADDVMMSRLMGYLSYYPVVLLSTGKLGGKSTDERTAEEEKRLRFDFVSTVKHDTAFILILASGASREDHDLLTIYFHYGYQAVLHVLEDPELEHRLRSTSRVMMTFGESGRAKDLHRECRHDAVYMHSMVRILLDAAEHRLIALSEQDDRMLEMVSREYPDGRPPRVMSLQVRVRLHLVRSRLSSLPGLMRQHPVLSSPLLGLVQRTLSYVPYVT